MKRGYGELLKKAREAKSLKHSDIHKDLKIDVLYLKALEDESCDAFEKPVYMKLFLRTYAKHLKVNEAEVVSLYEHDPDIIEKEKEVKLQATKKDVKIDIIKEERPPEIEEAGKIELTINTKKNIMIAAVVGLVIILIVIFSMLLSGGKGKNEAGEGQAVYKVPVTESLKIIAKGKSDVWMKARHDNGEEDFFLKKGEEKKWKDIQKIVFLIGNAAGVEFVTNGDSIGVIGEEGEVINGLVFQVGKEWYIDKGQGFKRTRKPTPTPIPTQTPVEVSLDEVPAGITPVETPVE